MGYVAQDYVEMLAEKASMRLFTVQVARDWLLRHEKECKDPNLIMSMAAEKVGIALAEYETEAMWRTIIPAVTNSFDGAGVLPPRPAAIHQMPHNDPAAGYFSKELVNRLLVSAQRQGRKVKCLLVSPEDLADIREWTEVDVDPITKNAIFQAGGLEEIWGVQLIGVEDLGVKGRYNINDECCEYGPFKGSQSHNKYNDYTITHGNIVSEGFNLQVAGETQIYALCEGTKENFKFRHTPYTAYFDPALFRRQKAGFFGWKKMGVMCMDPRDILMGVIDRHIPSGMSKEDWVDKQNTEARDKKEKAEKLDNNINRLTGIARQSPEKLEAILTLLGVAV